MQVCPGVRRILAPNPSPMTHWGTNTYLVGEGAVTVIDPGPGMPDHLDAILAGLEPGEHVARILVTHAHLDHSPLARVLSEATGAPVLGFGAAEAGRSPVMEALAADGLAGGGEGVDRGFRPDVAVGDGEVVEIGEGRRMTALWTPGHFAGHLCFALDGPKPEDGSVVFTGDHVMGWASTMISPPDGDLTAFMASCARLARRRDRLYLPAHGAPVQRPGERLDWLMRHRRDREAQVLGALAAGAATIDTLVERIYTETDARLLKAAGRNVFAHLVDLETRGLTRATPKLAPDATFERVD